MVKGEIRGGGSLDLFLEGRVLRQMYRFRKTTFFHSLPPCMRARLGAGRLTSSRTPNHPGHPTILDTQPSRLPSPPLPLTPPTLILPAWTPPTSTFLPPSTSALHSSTLLPAPSAVSPFFHPLLSHPLFHSPFPPSTLPPASRTLHSSTRLSHPPLFHLGTDVSNLHRHLHL